MVMAMEEIEINKYMGIKPVKVTFVNQMERVGQLFKKDALSDIYGLITKHGKFFFKRTAVIKVEYYPQGRK